MILVFNNFIITQRRQRSVLRSMSQRRAGLEQALTCWFAHVPGASPTKAVNDRRLLMQGGNEARLKVNIKRSDLDQAVRKFPGE